VLARVCRWPFFSLPTIPSAPTQPLSKTSGRPPCHLQAPSVHSIHQETPEGRRRTFSVRRAIVCTRLFPHRQERPFPLEHVCERAGRSESAVHLTANGVFSLKTGCRRSSRAAATLPFPAPTLQSTRSADVAQLVEQPIRNRQVTGSSPVVGSR
jgi:hypothetical protein